MSPTLEELEKERRNLYTEYATARGSRFREIGLRLKTLEQEIGNIGRNVEQPKEKPTYESRAEKPNQTYEAPREESRTQKEQPRAEPSGPLEDKVNSAETLRAEKPKSESKSKYTPRTEPMRFDSVAVIDWPKEMSDIPGVGEVSVLGHYSPGVQEALREYHRAVDTKTPMPLDKIIAKVKPTSNAIKGGAIYAGHDPAYEYCAKDLEEFEFGELRVVDINGENWLLPESCHFIDKIGRDALTSYTLTNYEVHNGSKHRFWRVTKPAKVKKEGAKWKITEYGEISPVFFDFGLNIQESIRDGKKSLFVKNRFGDSVSMPHDLSFEKQIKEELEKMEMRARWYYEKHYEIKDTLQKIAMNIPGVFGGNLSRKGKYNQRDRTTSLDEGYIKLQLNLRDGQVFLESDKLDYIFSREQDYDNQGALWRQLKDKRAVYLGKE